MLKFSGATSAADSLFARSRNHRLRFCVFSRQFPGYASHRLSRRFHLGKPALREGGLGGTRTRNQPRKLSGLL